MTKSRKSNMPVLALRTALLAASIVDLAAVDVFANDRVQQEMAEPDASLALTAESTIGELLDHPSFKGFAPLILPWDNRPYDRAMPLTRIDRLLPYHSNVDIGVVVSSLNRMVADVDRGQRVFYDIYDETQKRADPSKRNTGLFFFRGKPGAPFAIIAPGGGFAYVGSVHEGFPYAAEISKLGYNAFVVRYRAGMGGQIATEDMAAAITFVFRNAGKLEVSTDSYSVWGSSAGARMAALIGSHGVAAFGGDDLPKPSTVVMAYTAHSDHSSDEPKTFVIVGQDDAIAPPSRMAERVEALRSIGTKVDYTAYPGVGHGFGLGTNTTAEGWVKSAIEFWRVQ